VGSEDPRSLWFSESDGNGAKEVSTRRKRMFPTRNLTRE